MSSGTLYIVGLGPGDTAYLTPAARSAIERADVVSGYKTYLELIPELLSGKETFSTGMRQETERCREALRRAAAGATVALVCAGDAGIYGMAGLVLELQQVEGPEGVNVEVVPGISAVQAAAARLGAPLMHDFAVISLSDLLTPWASITRRLEAAAGADFVIALYNPKSRGRVTQVEIAREILLSHRRADTPVGIVRNAMRSGEEVEVSTLANFTDCRIDMFSMVIIGNTTTFVDDFGRMVTPRGYLAVRGGSDQDSPASKNIAESNAGGGALFIGGTGSDVGKSLVTAGLCRLLRRQGVDVAPFKAQNMALNSAVTPDGGEIGRAQALQAEACRLQPSVHMNPVLLKPNSETGSQVILHGRPVGNMSVREYHAYKPQAWQAVMTSLKELRGEHRVVVMEGAGSIAEINLREQDITNLRVAAAAGARALLVADIDRGGVFASIYGTIALLTPEERGLLAGVIINKFRGDASLLQPGIEELERRTGIPVLGVLPWLSLRLPEEDSLALRHKAKRAQGEGLRVGVVRLPRISNYSDFDLLEREADVELCYVEDAADIADLDLLILPGTKSTLADRQWLDERGFDAAIHEFYETGGTIIGICGGFQLLGREIADPDGVEGEARQLAGLGLLDVTTVMLPQKQTHQVEGVLAPGAGLAGLPDNSAVSGYEIHMGETERGESAQPFALLLRRGTTGVDLADGAVSPDGRVWGSYLHDLFRNRHVRDALLNRLRRGRGLAPVIGEEQSLDVELDSLADHLAAHLDLPRLFSLTGLDEVVS